MVKKVLAKWIKLIAGIFFAPFAFFIIVEVGRLFLHLTANTKDFFYFLIGFSIYILVHFLLFNFSRMYIIAHEMTHAFFAWICGIKIKDISIRQDSGHVNLSGSNAFVLLAPYLVPLYALLFFGLYVLMSEIGDVSQYKNIVNFIFGVLFSFHIVHTLKGIIETKQSDLSSAGGQIFSIVLILAVNGLILLLALKYMFAGEINLKILIWDAFLKTLTFWKIIYLSIKDMILNIIQNVK